VGGGISTISPIISRIPLTRGKSHSIYIAMTDTPRKPLSEAFAGLIAMLIAMIRG
jgi:hypothetical protein